MGFSLGALQAVLARDGVVRAREVKNDYLFRAMLFHGFIMVPVGMMFFGNWSDWSVFYAWDAVHYPKIGWIFVFGYLPVGLAGNAIAQKLIRSEKLPAAIALVAAPLAALAALTLWAGNRFLKVGTLEEFNAGTAPWLWESRGILIAFAGSGILVGGGLALVIWLNWKQAREEAAG